MKYPNYVRESTVFEDFIQMILEDIRKYGVIDEYGQMWIDSGLQKQMIGRIKNEK